jgi:hypothetical protein
LGGKKADAANEAGLMVAQREHGIRKPVYVTELGPAMLELSERQRNFVLAYCAFPQASGQDLARMAGYESNCGKDGSQNWRSTASRMLRSPPILAAIHECLTKTYRGRGAAIAQDVMLTIAQDKKHKDQLKAAAMLADRGGFGAFMESKVTIEHRDQTSEALIARITLLARRLGIEPDRLLGTSMQKTETPVIVETIDGHAEPADRGRALAGPEGSSAGGGNDGARGDGAAGPDLAGDLPLQPQQQTVRGHQ